MQIKKFMDADAVESLIDVMAGKLWSLLNERGIDAPMMIGIRTGGVWLAQQLHQELGLQEPLGTLDISFYRDDFTQIGMNPEVHPSDLPLPVDGRHIILIDDVLHTGRTIRAALNEIFDYGRPASIILATLVERSGRELPIEADVVGLRPTLAADQHITLTGPSPLGLVIGSRSNRSSRNGDTGEAR
ncbi:bifunctional pyr operon transcriptional regulator/uracil phosphoribosyltransferase PyrR [Candidatus Endoriftia persephonae]|jgi:pyrimidine operon attenuation protein/uracil phosphoribosyltransferase|uniref:Bifunctional protein PyrR n=4 Tax=Gammaproteobacteria TaxID=1236 RepID=G2FJD9_9GAMM|nr:bifunctional pyr operon transcriptional regulator/uracil phosphoribosyltransferase PyrR [Candidatus Endoriftia persephone]EGV50962.1 bifunctional protein pyrR [endosymbiont of Riftia pachyptila (vent Ph05)]EGW53086.1 bifunctional protein PyrR [endosymbiont of Tevnia jerichonana (vent Tica)]KRT54794.1 Pyrimidine operon attenuation protein/uracil phosphoribosyltransferase [endosymbiont of Ridgeia piscesae]KRT59155.1 pyrimidine operon attenuation protein / uracil phosphoribosyltransferase [endo